MRDENEVKKGRRGGSYSTSSPECVLVDDDGRDQEGEALAKKCKRENRPEWEKNGGKFVPVVTGDILRWRFYFSFLSFFIYCFHSFENSFSFSFFFFTSLF